VSTAEVDMWHYIKKKSLKNKNYLKKKEKKKKKKERRRRRRRKPPLWLKWG